MWLGCTMQSRLRVHYGSFDLDISILHRFRRGIIVYLYLDI